jgi:hypothetical protein
VLTIAVLPPDVCPLPGVRSATGLMIASLALVDEESIKYDENDDEDEMKSGQGWVVWGVSELRVIV